MTLADWATETRARYQQKSPSEATRAAAREFVRGARRRLTHLAYEHLGKQTATSRIAGARARFHVDSPTDVERARTLNREQEVAKWLFQHVDSSSVFWDVGAYHGHYSVIAAQLGATTVAFEPHPENQRRVEQHRALNRVDIDIRGVALSDHADTALIGGHTPSEAHIHASSGAETPLQRGDNVAAPTPDVVKIDVEGHETEVLDGLRNTLPHVERIAIEVHDTVDPDTVRQRLTDAGLTVRELESPRSQTYLGGQR